MARSVVLLELLLLRRLRRRREQPPRHDQHLVRRRCASSARCADSVFSALVGSVVPSRRIRRWRRSRLRRLDSAPHVVRPFFSRDAALLPPLRDPRVREADQRSEHHLVRGRRAESGDVSGGADRGDRGAGDPRAAGGRAAVRADARTAAALRRRSRRSAGRAGSTARRTT